MAGKDRNASVLYAVRGAAPNMAFATNLASAVVDSAGREATAPSAPVFRAVHTAHVSPPSNVTAKQDGLGCSANGVSIQTLNVSFTFIKLPVATETSLRHGACPHLYIIDIESCFKGTQYATVLSTKLIICLNCSPIVMQVWPAGAQLFVYATESLMWSCTIYTLRLRL